MIEVINQCANDPEIIELARTIEKYNLSSEQIATVLLNFAYRNIYYQADPPTSQQIKTPFRALHDAKGNCVDYSVFIASVLKALHKKPILRIAQIGQQSGFTHVYIVFDGIVIDPVIFQSEDDREHLTRPLNSQQDLKPGKECNYKRKLDFLI